MKTNKRVVLLVLVLLLLLIGGCSPANVTTFATQAPTAGKSPVSGIVGGGDEKQIARQVLPEQLENPDGLPVLKWVCLTDRSVGISVWNKIWRQEAAEAVNQALAEQNAPYRLQIVLFTSNKFGNDWFSEPSVQKELADADLVFGYFTPDRAKNLLLPITEYAQGTAQPSLKNAVVHEYYWQKAVVDGEIYGIESGFSCPNALGWILEDAVTAQYGLAPEDAQKSFWEMDAFFAQLYQTNGQTPFFYLPKDGIAIGNLGQTYTPAPFDGIFRDRFQLITSCYGVDYSGETPRFVNYLATDHAQNCQAALQRYLAAGYISDSAENVLLGYARTYSDSIYSMNSLTYVPVEALRFDYTWNGGFWSGITKTSDQSENALALLHLIAEDVRFRKLLCFGEEGVDYRVDNGVLTSVIGEENTVYTMQFLSGLYPFSGLNTGLPIPTEEGVDIQQTYVELLDKSNVWYPMDAELGYDISDLEQEIAAVNQVLDRYLTRFSELTKEEYQSMLAEIDAAGGQKILSALQQQLDTWLSKNTPT